MGPRMSDPAGTWVLWWFDIMTDELVRKLPLTDEMRYGDHLVDVPNGQELQVGFVANVVESGQIRGDS